MGHMLDKLLYTQSTDLTLADYQPFSNLKKNLYVDRFLTNDELKWAPEEWLKGSQQYFILLVAKNSEIVTNCALT